MRIVTLMLTDRFRLIGDPRVPCGTMVATLNRAGVYTSLAVAPEELGELVTEARNVLNGGATTRKWRRVDTPDDEEHVFSGDPQRRWFPTSLERGGFVGTRPRRCGSTRRVGA